MAHWYIDFEIYQFDHTCFVKEICTLKHDQSVCMNFHVKNPDDIKYLPCSQSMQYQMQRHQLSWQFRFTTFERAILEICKVVGTEAVYIKGYEKYLYLEQYIPHLIELDDSPSFNELNNCTSEICYVNHGKYCARRKVHELLFLEDSLV